MLHNESDIKNVLVHINCTYSLSECITILERLMIRPYDDFYNEIKNRYNLLRLDRESLNNFSRTIKGQLILSDKKNGINTGNYIKIGNMNYFLNLSII